jgi:YHS domain-containing protein
MKYLFAILALLLTTALMSGCGTPYATVPNRIGDPVMLLGHDPVAYFTDGRPVRGKPELSVSLPGRTYYFSSAAHLEMFRADASKYEPQYGGFCSSGAAFDIKLGSDPTAWQIERGRLFIFGDLLGQTAWQLDPAWNVAQADRLWPGMRDAGWRGQTLKRLVFRVPHYLSGRDIREQYQRRYPDKPWPTYDTGGMLANLIFKPPGWRAAEGFSQPALGYPP